ncbi:MAG: flavodoxin family protein [Sphaerochaetaceae bacterium]|jgi:flavodoxin|nr:nitric oxide synthase [Sphaerochaetaceae bacterium]NLO60652.1 nitric oxide synthase [Spirochaetales bacterium]MDD2406767.1 flavodoxin family protein [Sphaerochaetaceae bacterium]MDD4260086.1 flavodoxin family protein [Sphaerochaetaceae bacterium]MDD4763681.1 flavodoxin family protein [Sphaerochaetaceae bacterium]
MNILILYDSVFGNTAKVAEAMKNSVPEGHRVSAIKFDAFTMDMLKNLDVLVVGSPTRAFRPTPAISDLLKRLPSDALAQGIHTVAFDTRVSLKDVNSKFLNMMVALFGYAAEPIDKLLLKRGGTQLAEPKWFYVNGKEGPLKSGELESAAAWMNELLARLPMN